VEERTGGGAAFRVYLPAGPDGERSPGAEGPEQRPGGRSEPARADAI
jgi:hypothetical protein